MRTNICRVAQPRLKKGIRGFKTDEDVVRAIELLDDAGWGSAAEIREHLAKHHDYKERVPELRTVQLAIQRHHERQGKEEWSLSKAQLGQVRPVIEVLEDILEWSGGAITHVKKSEAEFILKIREAAPLLPPLKVWRAAREYVRRTSRGEDTSSLDSYLALFGNTEANRAQMRRIFVKAWGRVPFEDDIDFATVRRIIQEALDTTAQIDEYKKRKDK
jgi:hypothetical protein